MTPRICALTWTVLDLCIRPGKPHLKLWIGEYPPCGDC